MNALSIGKLAKAAQVSIHTIRFYEKSGLLPHPSRRPSGFREYSDLALQQLRFIRRARSLGLSLEEIAGLLAIEGQASSPLSVERQLVVVDRKIGELNRWRSALRALMLDQASPTPKRRSLVEFIEGEPTSTGVDSQPPEWQSLPKRDS